MEPTKRLFTSASVAVRHRSTASERFSWIGCARKPEKASRSAMLRGETDSLDLLGAQRVETVALTDPLLWAARQDFHDERVPRRSWVTEAMLAPAGVEIICCSGSGFTA